MKEPGLGNICRNLELIIDNLMAGTETYETEDDRYSFEDIIGYLHGFLEELKDLNKRISDNGNTPQLLEEVHMKYTELWLFQVNFTIDSLPLVIGALMRYPD